MFPNRNTFESLGAVPSTQTRSRQSRGQSSMDSQTPSICITGATAQCVIEHLVQTTSDIEIVAGVHDADSLDEAARRVLDKHCHDIVSLNSKSHAGLSSVDVLMLIPPSSKNRVQEVRALVKAAKAGGVKFILLLSIINSQSHANAMTRQFAQCEDAVEESGIPCAFLRTNFYMENILFQGQQLAQGQIMLPIREGKLNWIAMDDVGRALSVMLLEPEKFIGKSFELNGREALSGDEFARQLSTTLNKQIRFRSCTSEEYAQMLGDANVPGWLAQLMASFISSFEKNRGVETIDTVNFFKDLTGSKPVKFMHWLEGSYDTLISSIESYEQGKGRRFQGRRSRDSSSAMPRSQEQRTGTQQYSGMRSQSTSESKMSLDDMKSILDEVISERHAFTREEKDSIRINEERLQHLHKLKKRIQQMGNSKQGERVGQSRGSYMPLEQTGRNDFGTALRSDIVILEFDE